jgi:hypothetical protein
MTDDVKTVNSAVLKINEDFDLFKRFVEYPIKRCAKNLRKSVYYEDLRTLLQDAEKIKKLHLTSHAANALKVELPIHNTDTWKDSLTRKHWRILEDARAVLNISELEAFSEDYSQVEDFILEFGSLTIPVRRNR